MFRYNDGNYRTDPPAKVEYQGFDRNFTDLTREQWDEIGYNEALPVSREPFTAYETRWVKGADLIYREEIVTAVVDEAAKTESRAVEVRRERDRLLALCDWTQVADCPLTAAQKTAWADYRQALRDVPQQAGFPGVVEWPDKPAE